MTKNRFQFILATALLILAAGLLGSCTGSDGKSPTESMLGGPESSARNAEDGFGMVADPAEITFDQTDPDAPMDPDTGLLIAEIQLTASAVDELGAPQPDLTVVFASNFGSLASAGAGVLTDVDGLASDMLTVLEDSPDEILVTATDGTRTEMLVLTVIRIFPNRPPVADAGMDLGAECTSMEGTPVTLDGSASTDPDSTEGTNDDIVSFEWFEGFGTPDEVLLGEGQMLDLAFDLGSHTVTLRVTDSEGEAATDDLQIDIIDTTPPTLSFVLDPDLLWPPNHMMRSITATPTAMDACSEVTVTLTSVSSSEPDNGMGDGDTENDIQGVDAGAVDFEFLLRAERMGPGRGRVYTIEYHAEDDSGNTADATGTILVPHDMGNKDEMELDRN
jgi:hypothetical protein